MPRTIAYIANLLSTDHSGTAERHQGVTVTEFVTSIAAAVGVFVVQLFAFSALRRSLRAIYEPKAFLVPDLVKVTVSISYLGWIRDLIATSKLDDVIPSSGLDAYFFLRYILMQVGFWSGMSLTAAPILLSINGIFVPQDGSNSYGPESVDRFSWMNLAIHKPDYLLIHCFVALGVLGSLCYYIHRELCLYIEARQSYLLSGMSYMTYNTLKSQNRTLEPGKTILITDIPSNFQHKEKLKDVLSKYPGGVSRIWMNRDFSELAKMVAYRDYVLRKLERVEMKVIKNAKKSSTTEQQPVEDIFADFIPGLLHCKYLNEKDIPTCKVSRFPMWKHKRQPWIVKNLPLLTTTEDALSFYKYELHTLNEEITKFQLDADVLCPLINSCIVEFNSPLAAQMAKSQGPLIFSVLGPYFVNPSVYLLNDTSDIMWDHLTVHPFKRFVCQCFGDGAIVLLILMWAFPVAFIGFISQFQYLQQLIPQIKWIDGLSLQVIGLLSNFIPPIVLAFLFSWVPSILRQLVTIKKYPVKYQTELNIQHYLFVFLFVQTFLVLTMSTGITRVLYQAIRYPTSIPKLLAFDLPKSASFFTSYVILQGLSMAASIFLRTDKIISHFMGKWFFDVTARDFFERNLRNMETIDYARTLPIIVNIASITLTYSIISPLIILTATLSFILLYYAFKYRIMYCNSEYPQQQQPSSLTRQTRLLTTKLPILKHMACSIPRRYFNYFQASTVLNCV